MLPRFPKNPARSSGLNEKNEEKLRRRLSSREKPRGMRARLVISGRRAEKGKAGERQRERERISRFSATAVNKSDARKWRERDRRADLLLRCCFFREDEKGNILFMGGLRVDM